MAYLLLEDGSRFQGTLFGAPKEAMGEVVFTTGMCGYQEALTDPSHGGQIVVMTYPLMGNYGINDLDFESDGPKVHALLVKEHCVSPSNWKCEMTLDEYMRKNGVVGLCGVDTRAIVRHICTHGAMRGAVVAEEGISLDEEETLRQRLMGYLDDAPVKRHTCTHKYTINGNGVHIGVIDMGVKRSSLECLRRHHCQMTVYPANVRSDEILADNPDGIFISGGPGDPKDNPETIRTLRELAGKKPVLGICLGYQVLALALGADTAKLLYGHRGANIPVKNMETGKCQITVQNHGYGVAEESLPENLTITHRNWNDKTVAGIRLKGQPVMGVCYLPQAKVVPGGEDVISEFLHMARQAAGKGGEQDA